MTREQAHQQKQTADWQQKGPRRLIRQDEAFLSCIRLLCSFARQDVSQLLHLASGTCFVLRLAVRPAIGQSPTSRALNDRSKCASIVSLR